MAACAQCGTSLPRGVAACPSCGTPAPRPAKRVAAKPAAQPARKPAEPVVKAVADPVAPKVKGGAAPVTPARKTTPAKRAAEATPGEPAAPGKAAAARSRARTRSQAGGAARAERALPEFVDPYGTEPAPRRPEPADPYADPYAAAYAEVDAVIGGPEPVAPPEDAAPPAPPRRRAWSASAGDVIGEADERRPEDPVGTPYEPPPPLLPAVEERFDDDPVPGRGWPVPLRVVRGEWPATLRTALPALGVTLLVAALATASLLLATRPAGDEPLVGSMSSGRWARYVCAAVGLAFGGRVRVTADTGDSGFGSEFGYGVRFVPLTVTFAALGALWFFARRTHQRNVVPDRVPDALRAALVYAAGVGAITYLGRWDNPTSSAFPTEAELTMRYVTSPGPAAFWAFCAAFAVVWLASGRVVVTGPWARRLLAARGALVGLGAGCAASFLLLVVFGYAYADRVGADSGDVTNALPLALAFAAGAAPAAFGVLSGGRFVLPAITERSEWSLLAPGAPGWFPLLAVVPLVSVAVGAAYVLRRPGVPRAEAVRACAGMWLPAGAVWLLVVAVASPHVVATGAGGLVAGPVLWGALIVALWFGAGGWAAGRLLARYPRLLRQQAPEEPVETAGSGDAFDPPLNAT